MSDIGAPRPDPTAIGETSTPPFARLPDPERLFARRADRFRTLAKGAELGPYLEFLGRLCDVQHAVQDGLQPAPTPAAETIERARIHAMPPIDREKAVEDEGFMAIFDRLVARAREIDMPAPAREALGRVASADGEGRRTLARAVVANRIPVEAVAEHVFAAAAVQVHLARLAAGLDAGALVPVAVGVCPACGGRPATSSVMGAPGIENVRYASCAGCATQWNEVRVKCLCCGSTKGLGYRSVDTVEATVKAEHCRECGHWVKIFYQAKNPSLDPVADDVGSLGLDVLMRDAGVRRGGFNPFLVGY